MGRCLSLGGLGCGGGSDAIYCLLMWICGFSTGVLLCFLGVYDTRGPWMDFLVWWNTSCFYAELRLHHLYRTKCISSIVCSLSLMEIKTMKTKDLAGLLHPL